MQPLLDGDIFLHEIGWSGEFKDKETGEEVLLPFSTVEEILDNRIADICAVVGATKPPIIYLTSSEAIVRLANQLGATYIHEDNFRYSVATTQPYKGNRKTDKPFHFYNIAAYLLSNYDTRVSQGGLEADDCMSIEQYGRDDTIICSRDKDLRICPGWHYSWECGKQREIGPHYTDALGSLTMTDGKVIGYGLKFFYYQMLVGDSADYIPGLKGWGPVKAFKLLGRLDSEDKLKRAVVQAYKGEGKGEDYYNEQKALLWIKQDAMENGLKVDTDHS